MRRLVDISDSQAIKLYKAILPEAVLGVKELNEKCRTSAYQLITSIIEKLLPNKEAFDDFIRALTTGFAGSPIYISATILATASITFHFNGIILFCLIKHEIFLTVERLLNVVVVFFYSFFGNGKSE